MQYIIFTSNNQHYALDISKIDKIIENEIPKKIPESTEYLLGVIQYDNRILPIIDLTMRLYNIKFERGNDDKIIVVMWKDKQIGLVVESIMGIRSIEEVQIEESGHDIQVSNEYIDGFIKAEGDITIILNSDKLFNLEQEKEIGDVYE